jgi:hypothetical protein
MTRDLWRVVSLGELVESRSYPGATVAKGGFSAPSSDSGHVIGPGLLSNVKLLQRMVVFLGYI